MTRFSRDWWAFLLLCISKQMVMNTIGKGSYSFYLWSGSLVLSCTWNFFLFRRRYHQKMNRKLTLMSHAGVASMIALYFQRVGSGGIEALQEGWGFPKMVLVKGSIMGRGIVEIRSKHPFRLHWIEIDDDKDDIDSKWWSRCKPDGVEWTERYPLSKTKAQIYPLLAIQRRWGRPIRNFCEKILANKNSLGSMTTTGTCEYDISFCFILFYLVAFKF